MLNKFEYLEAVLDSDDYIHNTSYFCCSGCGSSVGNYLQIELNLLEYLSSEVSSQEEIQEIMNK